MTAGGGVRVRVLVLSGLPLAAAEPATMPHLHALAAVAEGAGVLPSTPLAGLHALLTGSDGAGVEPSRAAHGEVVAPPVRADGGGRLGGDTAPPPRP